MNFAIFAKSTEKKIHMEMEIIGSWMIAGGVAQKIVVFSPSFLTPTLVNQISKCIKETGLLGAQVVVALDFELLNIELEPMGIIIDSHGMIAQWNLEEIRKRVGQDFYRDD